MVRHARTHVRTHARTHVRTHARTHAHTHTHTHAAAAGVHGQRRRDICNCSTRTAAVTTHTYSHFNNTRMGIRRWREVTHALKGVGRNIAADGTPRGSQQQQTTGWHAHFRRAQRWGYRGDKTHTHTSIARASAPGECARSSATGRGENTHTRTRGSSNAAERDREQAGRSATSMRSSRSKSAGAHRRRRGSHGEGRDK